MSENNLRLVCFAVSVFSPALNCPYNFSGSRSGQRLKFKVTRDQRPAMSAEPGNEASG
jgi:hypothetical protein